MSLTPTRRLALAAAALGVLGGCVFESRSSGAYYPTQVYSSGGGYATQQAYGFQPAYAPGYVYYAGGYYGGSYYRPGYYQQSAPFVSVQASPYAVAAPNYGPGYAPGYAPNYGGGVQVYGGGAVATPVAPAYPVQQRPIYQQPAVGVAVPVQPGVGAAVAVPSGGGGGAAVAVPVGPR